MMEPGWYHAEGDPPGTQRWWDGELWQGAPVPSAPQVPPPPPPGHGGYGGGNYGYGYGYRPYYPEASQATTALVLGILGIVVCGLCGPFAWQIGNKEIAGIDAGRRDPSNRGTAQAGRVLGMIVTGLMALGAMFVLLVLTSAV